MAALINKHLWDPSLRFYFDLKADGQRAPVKTIAAYWTLLARVARPAQAADLVAQLRNPATFGRPHRVPTLAADEPGYDRAGGYWRGAVWVPTDMMVIRGLENFGYADLAREIAFEHLDRVASVFEKTGTIWENYRAGFRRARASRPRAISSVEAGSAPSCSCSRSRDWADAGRAAKRTDLGPPYGKEYRVPALSL